MENGKNGYGKALDGLGVEAFGDPNNPSLLEAVNDVAVDYSLRAGRKVDALGALHLIIPHYHGRQDLQREYDRERAHEILFEESERWQEYWEGVKKLYDYCLPAARVFPDPRFQRFRNAKKGEELLKKRGT